MMIAAAGLPSLQEEGILRASRVADDVFQVFRDVVSDVDIESICAAMSDPSLPRTRAGIRHALRLPAVSTLANSAPLTDIARSVLGGTAIPFRATLFDKSPTSNWLVVWHQDTAVPIQEKRDVSGWGPWSVKEGITYAHAPASALECVVALRVHLDDSNADNGPLRVLRGSHILGVLSDDAIHQTVSQSTSIDCIVPKGGILAMRPLVVHSSSKS